MGEALRHMLRNGWKHRGVLAWVLWPSSLLFAALVALRSALYRMRLFRSVAMRVPVIVVGNVVAGGGGKTPVVMELVRHLRNRGYVPGVVSRGYGRTTADCREVHKESRAEEAGDEPLLIARTTGVPVVVGARRADAAHLLLARHPEVDVLVCDDGLQHYALRRDIDICVFDEGGTGNGFLLPAGPLREPWPRPVDLVLHAGEGWRGPGFRLVRRLASHASRADGTRVALRDLREAQDRPGGELEAVAGIAAPQNFFAMLRAQGLHLRHARPLSDHADTAQLLAQRGSGTLLCTEKDATKLWPSFPDALAVPLQLHIAAEFWEAFDALLAARAGPKLSSRHGHPSS